MTEKATVRIISVVVIVMFTRDVEAEREVRNIGSQILIWQTSYVLRQLFKIITDQTGI